MSCEDEDDFTVLKTHQWPVDAFVDGAEVVLWRADAETPIGCSEGFVRLARVEKGWTGGVVTRSSRKIALRVHADLGRKWQAIPELQLQAAGVREGVAFEGPWQVIERGQRMLHGGNVNQKRGTMSKLYTLPPPGATESVRCQYALPGEEQLFREMLVVPVQHVPVRIAKFDVCLKEEPL